MSKSKVNLYVDIDNTIYNSTARVVDILNKKYNSHLTGNYVDYKDVKGYNFKDKFPQVSEEEVEQIFQEPDFYTDGFLYSYLTLVAFMALDKLYKKYGTRINFVTLGTLNNLEHKRQWIERTCDIWDIDYNEYYGDTNNESDKTFVDMSNGIFIDDNIECLRNSNASIKILLKNGVDTEWNKVLPNDEVYIVNDWYEALEIIEFFHNNEGLI